ncbi:uncharacterized protein LOC128822905 [Vidua macroura]|uniref:uncharacterized protein LOC128822905 n=1 Tax=Vidua macroura TaxID=187451 RepID=UPI0023A7D2AA|nr:uncharacterized protein LOC128822905 [Vidua macroura]
MSNSSSTSHFLLLALADTRQLQLLHFCLLLGISLAALLGNGLIISAGACGHHLHTPMFFFLLNLALSHLGSICTTVPKAMHNSLWDTSTISYTGCAAQLFFFLFFIGAENFLLTIKCYNRYVSICKPLHYGTLLGSRACAHMAAAAWASAFLNALLLMATTFSLPLSSMQTLKSTLAGSDPLAILRVPCDGTQGDLFQNLAGHRGAFQARLQDLLTRSFSKASLLQVASNPVTAMEQRSLRGPKLAWVQEEEEGPGAAPVEEIKEVVQFKTLQEDAAVDRTQEQDPARGLFRRTVEVPAMVRYIHQWLMDNQFAEQRLKRALLDLTEEQPADVVMTLLCVAPSCDRAAFTMWKSIMCSPRTAEPVQLILLDVLGSWPEHSTFTSDGDKTSVFVLAATVVMWKILQVPCVPQMVTVYFPHLLVHLLFQVFFSTLDMPEEVDTFWKGCQQQYGLATSPNRFAVRTLKSLLCQMEHEDVVLAMERKRGWDTLLCADTHHYAVGLLAR